MASTIPAAAKVLLDAIAQDESAGRYDVIYGGGKISDFSAHPGTYIDIKSGPNKGEKSSAAGRYQFLESTWKDQAKKLGLKDFSPESQDRAAWNLAQEVYRKETGGNLLKDLEAGKTGKIASALKSTWTSLPSGIEQGANAKSFRARLAEAAELAAAPVPADPTGPLAKREAIANTPLPSPDPRATSATAAIDDLLGLGEAAVDPAAYAAQPKSSFETGVYAPPKSSAPPPLPPAQSIPAPVDPNAVAVTRSGTLAGFDLAKYGQARQPVDPSAPVAGQQGTLSGFDLAAYGQARQQTPPVMQAAPESAQAAERMTNYWIPSDPSHRFRQSAPQGAAEAVDTASAAGVVPPASAAAVTSYPTVQGTTINGYDPVIKEYTDRLAASDPNVDPVFPATLDNSDTLTADVPLPRPRPETDALAAISEATGEPTATTAASAFAPPLPITDPRALPPKYPVDPSALPPLPRTDPRTQGIELPRVDPRTAPDPRTRAALIPPPLPDPRTVASLVPPIPVTASPSLRAPASLTSGVSEETDPSLLVPNRMDNAAFQQDVATKLAAPPPIVMPTRSTIPLPRPRPDTGLPGTKPLGEAPPMISGGFKPNISRNEQHISPTQQTAMAGQGAFRDPSQYALQAGEVMGTNGYIYRQTPSGYEKVGNPNTVPSAPPGYTPPPSTQFIGLMANKYAAPTPAQRAIAQQQAGKITNGQTSGSGGSSAMGTTGGSYSGSSSTGSGYVYEVDPYTGEGGWVKRS